jgi:VIT1/CCC1 family predicted Fe2+/Mn2+ transporter/predicted RNA-binding Zn-ribbon protein involved in translation (DUF1610 family)
VLVFWLLGFAVRDIATMPGPSYADLESKFMDQRLVEEKSRLDREIAALDRALAAKREELRLAKEKSENLQRTIQQLIELERLALQNGKEAKDVEKTKLSASLASFLSSQGGYQTLNDAILELTSRKAGTEDLRRGVEERLSEQRKAASKDYERLWKAHRMKLAFYQLALLLPLVLAAGYMYTAAREDLLPLALAFCAATLIKTGLVVHASFPSRFFKYALILALIAVAVRGLVWLLKMERFPKREWLLRQYRAAYERFLCPVFAYPIRTGPRKYLYWTARTVRKVLVPASSACAGEDEPYVCPSCGTSVFERCPSCGKIRHSLLDNCQHCGAKRPDEIA